MNSNFEYCRKLVQHNDYDRYLISLRAPKKVQHYLWALFAFNHETAKTREIVTETQLGLIRLQWWREEIDKIYTGQPCKDNQILPALADAINDCQLTKDHFETLLYAREFDLEDIPPENLEGLVSYADFTNTPLLKLMGEICRLNSNQESLRHLGIAYGLIGVMRSIPFHATQSRSFIPSSLKAEGGAEAEIVETVCCEAIRNLDLAMQDKVSQPFSALKTIVQVNQRLLNKAKYDPKKPSFQKEGYLKPFFLLFCT